MKRLLLLVLFILFLLPIVASADTIQLKVKGVEIGTPYSTVIRKLGKPLLSKKGGTFPCDQGNPMLTLRYSGLIIKLIVDNKRRNFFVASMQVTSPKWITSGVIVGATVKAVRRKFGQNNKQSSEKGLEDLLYFIEDGAADFYFRNNKLVKIEWMTNLC